eukprot:c29119_g3_i1 orf=154-3498(+)
MAVKPVSHRASDVFVRALENENVQYIFGIPGEENLDLLDSLKDSKIKLVLTRHEQAAGFMAATVGRITGKVGVCLATLGPGATNFATSAAYAQLAGFPMMMITGQKPIRKSKQGSFQVVDIVENMRPVTKLTKQIADGDLIPSLVREAIRQAEEERPGAVHLELPEDIAGTMTNADLFPVHPVRRPIAEEKAISKAVQMIEAASHPLLLVGAGANRKRTQNMLRQFVDKLGIPFVTTQMGKGVITEAHPLYLGCCALSAMDYPHVCIEKADLIINVGHDVVEKPPFFMQHGKPPLVIHVNFYSAKVDNVYFPQLEVVGDIANAIWQIKERMTCQAHWDYRFMLQTKHEGESHMSKGMDDSRYPLVPQRIVADLRRAMPDDGVVCLDNGMYKIWFARCYRAYEPNTLLLDNALASMGAGLPSAIAVSLLYPQKKVVAVCGDGGFMMNSQEMETAVRLHLNLTVLILNDNAYGMIKWKQDSAGYEEFGLDVGNPDFVNYASSYGAKGYRVTKSDELLKHLHDCLFLSPPGVKLIEVPIDYQWSNEILNKELPGLVNQRMASSETEISLSLSEAAEEPGTFNPDKKDDDAGVADKSTRFTTTSAIKVDPVLKDPVNVQKPENACNLEKSNAGFQRPSEIRTYPFYLANKPMFPNTKLEITDKYTGKVFAQCALATVKDIDASIAASERAVPAMAAMASFERKIVLETVVLQVQARFNEFAYALCMEAGKPIRDACGEVQRLIDTFTIAAEECTRLYGEYAPMDISERAKGYQALVRRFPIGPVSMISPFNFPLNLAAHKIAPAIAVGCPFVLKPASRTPIGALLLGEILSQCKLPEGAFSILPCSRDGADLFTTDERLKLVSFTGSPSVGWGIKAKSGKKKVVLELGGNAACVVEDLIPDIKTVVERILHGAFYQSGQSCISVQRVYIHTSHYGNLRDALVAAASDLIKGDPLEETTFVGPLIDESEACRIESWVNKAVSHGAKILTGGKRNGLFYDATILEDVHPDMEVLCEEVFGPVMVLIPYEHFKTAIGEVNKSKFGLQAGVFVSDINKAFYAFQNLDVGGVCINDVPSMRIDSQPYGGVKDSGIGREGIRYAMEDMTEVRVMLLRHVGQIPM